MSTQDTLSLLRAALAAAGNPEELAKANTLVQPTSATQGLQDYDLSPAVLNLYPVLTPLRNVIPRVGGGKSIQANWKAVTAIDTGSIFAGVSEGHRGSVVGLATKEFFASYRTLGSEASLTDEAVLAAADFDDVRARAANTGLQALMIGEEKVILGGNTSFPLGLTPTPTLVASTSGGALVTGTVSVVCVALSFDGKNRATVASGVAVGAGAGGAFTRVTADGYTDTFGGGVAIKSAAAAVAVTGPNASVLCNVAPVRGAYGYAWYAGTAGSEMIFAVTFVSQVTLTALPTSGQAASALTAGSDNSTNSLIHDGLLTMAANPASGAGWLAQTAGQGLTGDGTGGIVEFDNILQAYWDNLRMAPSAIWISSQEMLTIRKRILAGGAGANQSSRFVFNVQQGQITGGGVPKGYLNPFAMGNGPAEIPLNVHPYMPPGTVMFLADSVPYALNNITNILQIRCRRDYYQTEWPRRTRAYEYGVYTDQVLQNFFMPGMFVLTNLANV